ncbi:rabankyrin-5 [Eurytemora carolleeae]|uniref:rabankyrin-5 n=1 Tax=Eurytemora carolleeae TaxID=1294199 RepID=UPI000C78EE9A|nr:rabankyrin-5 [Eurytemora carolleeae]|eukprot:XP_023334642.1 rabankyrin-5-like [Eurytemora affinis]
MSQSEVDKLSQHLSLLRTEYVKLQQKCVMLERENSVLAAENGEQGQDSFISRLLATVSSLYNQPLYSDLTIITPSSNIHAHKFVLSCRSDCWGVSSLSEVESLNWVNLGEDVSLALLRWIYTDQITLSGGDQFTLTLMAVGSQFKLRALVDSCEQNLVSSVSVSNCISFFATADRINAERLKDHCTQLISANWDKFTYKDFIELSPELVYTMLKKRASFPLHSAIELKREDVVFLYLIEFNSELSIRMNETDDRGRLPLDLALATAQYGIAKSLVEHQVNVNQMNKGGLSVLHLAIVRNDPAACIFLLKNGAQVNLSTQAETNTPLHLIASSLNPELLEVAREIILRNGDINLQNKEGETALHIAIQSENTALFCLLLEEKANLELVTRQGKPPLWFALMMKEEKFEENSYAQRLVEAGADVNSICSPASDTILHLLAGQAREEACLFLVSSGANVNKINRRGESVLHLAAIHGLATLATALLVAGADPNLQTSIVDGDTWRQTALHLALLNKQETVVSCLLEFSQPSDGLSTVLLDLNLKNSEDETPLALALHTGFSHLADLMIESGADVNITDANGFTLLQKAIVDGNPSAAIFLLQHGADINIRSPQGMTPLELAIRADIEPVVEKLCLAGADTQSSSTGEPPVWIALDLGLEDIASIIVRHGVDTEGWGPGPDECDQTLLHRAIDENREDIACFLIRSGCDLNSPRRPGHGGKGGLEAFDGQGPLHLSSQWGQEKVVTCLIEHGADINKQDAEGKTVLHHAIENGQSGIINMVLGCPGINLSCRDKAGLSPFACAMTFKNNSAARVILELEPGAAEHPDARGKNFLHTAILRGDLEALLFLISISVNVHSKTTDANKLAPLLLAVQVGNEMMVRNLILAGANVQERTLTGQTGLHIAAERDLPEIASVLINNNIEYAAVDEDGNNALHVAVREGNVKTVQVLLSESRIDAELLNEKGRSPLHVLARFTERNTTDIFNVFMETMPEYPIDKQDTEGNTPLLSAYIKGNGDLCRALVNQGAVLGTMNKNMVSMFNHPVATKQLLFRLLDMLGTEPRWGEGDLCQECQTKFGLTTRKHHCRHCGRLLCGKCSAKEMPIIKYNLTKSVRVCGVCSDLLTLGVGAGV